MNGRLCIYYRRPPLPQRWFKGDQYLRAAAKWIAGKKDRPGSLEKVFTSLCQGLDRTRAPYIKNLPFRRLEKDDIAIVLGVGKGVLKGYDRLNPIVAGIGLMTHPAEWPDLFQQYPVKVYLQHSEWTAAIYRKYYGGHCDIWPVGIDTDKWQPARPTHEKDIDVLVYDKIMFGRNSMEKELLLPIINYLDKERRSYRIIRYGTYREEEFRDLLSQAKTMVFLCEHESQGIAYQEAMAMDVPLFAWDQGKWLDPNRFAWGETDVPATSVPYFDERCGMKFRNAIVFCETFKIFWEKATNGAFSPRSYTLENLTLEKSARTMIGIVDKWTNRTA